MTEAVLHFLVGKLANIIEKEMDLLGGVGKKVELVQRELIRIRCCLRDADSKRKGDLRVQNWLNELRDVAYCIEDATDTFFLEFEDNRRKDPKFLKKFKQWLHMPMGVPVLHKLGTELEKIQKELEEISKSRVDYGIEPLQDKGKGETIVLPFRRATYQDLNETEVVGLHTDKDNILKLLRPEKTLRRAVITIVGTGGLGKTTLAHMVYRSARAEFEYHIMLSISQQFSLIDLLRKMLLSISQKFNITELSEKLHQNRDELENLDVGHLISELKKELRSRRYLIILDDVWEVDMWTQLKDALPDVKNGSRVVMTSRFIDVAKSAESKMAPYELNFLDDQKSLDLLLKKAFPYQEPDEECPRDLLGLAEELSKKCKGLPLALIVIGGILSTKENSYPVWERVLRTMNWHSDGKDCMQVLAMSYEDMPYYLKTCFLYLAFFPEDYEISAKRLTRMWVAEGFLPQQERKTMEETAEDCLEQLFQRSMVQVSSRCMNGSIKCCQVHDLLRNLAMHEANQENFVMVFSKESDVNQPNKRIRRASLQYSFQAQQENRTLFDLPLKFTLLPPIEQYVGPNTRSLLLFGLHLSKCSNFRLLKILEVVGVTSYTRDLLWGLDELMHLKYLGFRNCDVHIDFSSCSFRRIKTLETLDVRGTTAQLPNALWTIGTLRHVLCDRGTLDGPISTVDLRNLQTLRWVSPMMEWDRKLPLLNNLCKLGVSTSFQKWVTVTNLLQTLPFLVSLMIKGKSLPMEIVYPKALPNYQNLQLLYLDGMWSKNVTLEADLFPPHLVKLTLIRSRLEQNPMPELGKLKSLKKLCLKEHVSNYTGSTICLEGFPVLEYLLVNDWSIKDFTVAQGVMPKLTYLQVRDNIQLNLPPELQHVTIRKDILRVPLLLFDD